VSRHVAAVDGVLLVEPDRFGTVASVEPLPDAAAGGDLASVRVALRYAFGVVGGLAAKALAAGDLFFMTYSGHGGQVPDVSGDEPDKKDETWCFAELPMISGGRG